MDNWLFRLVQRLIPAAIIIATLALISVIVLVFVPEWHKSFPYFRDSVTALSTAAMVVATLLLAYVTFNVINSDRQREERLRKERYLNEITTWATDVIDFTAGQTALRSKDILEVMTSDLPVETIVKTVSHEQRVKLNKLSSKSVYILSLRTRLFPNNTDLHIAIHNVRRKIYEHIRYLELEMKGKIKNTAKPTQIHLARLLQDAIRLVKISVDTYTEIK